MSTSLFVGVFCLSTALYAQLTPFGPRHLNPQDDFDPDITPPATQIAPDWRHPVSGLGIDAMLARLGPEQLTRPLAGDDGQP